MRRLKHQVSWVVLSLLLVSVFMNCGPSFQMAQKNTATGSTSLASNASSAQAKAVLQNRCASCHTGAGSGSLSNIMDEAQLKAGGWVIPGNANNSPLVRRVYDGSMPPGQPLSNSEQDLLLVWVNGMAVAATPTPIPGGGIGAPGGPVSGGPTPTPVPPAAGLQPTFTNVFAAVLGPRCVGCHGNAGGVSYSNYTNTLRTVNKANPLGSALWVSIANGSMPKGSDLSAAEKKLVQDWLMAGSLNN